MTRAKYLSLIATSIALLFGISTTVFKKETQVRTVPILTTLAEHEPDGWKAVPLKISATERESKRVMSVLNFDEIYYKEFSKDGHRSFSVLVLYWRPNPANLNALNAHSPDVCFPSAGWVKMQNEIEEITYAAESRLIPAQVRRFENDGEEVCVIYWHLVSGNLSGEMVSSRRSVFDRAKYKFMRAINDFPRGGINDELFVRICIDPNGSNDLGGTELQAVSKLLGTLGLRG